MLAESLQQVPYWCVGYAYEYVAYNQLDMNIKTI